MREKRSDEGQRAGGTSVICFAERHMERNKAEKQGDHDILWFKFAEVLNLIRERKLMYACAVDNITRDWRLVTAVHYCIHSPPLKTHEGATVISCHFIDEIPIV